MTGQVPSDELQSRLSRFRKVMDQAHAEWAMAVIISKITLYYFTGTMQEGMLMIPRDGEAVFWVRKSYERALEESLFPLIRPMNSYRDAAGEMKDLPQTVYLETEIIPLAMYQRMNKYFNFQTVRSLDLQIAAVRAVKSAYELACMITAGEIHRRVLEERVPWMLSEGMSEAELGVQLFAAMIEDGAQGLVRFGMFENEIILGHIGFGDSAIYPSYFNGASGTRGLGPEAPVLGSRERKLRQGDLVYIDIGCGYAGYQTDKTMTYMYGKSLPKEVLEAHQRCVEIQNRLAESLRPGEIPSEIYTSTMKSLDPAFLENFMGLGKRRVKFLGHSIGLLVDELPVLAEGFDEPLQEGMVFALEPKKAFAGIGMCGIENTFLVTPQGGKCLTGSHPGLMKV